MDKAIYFSFVICITFCVSLLSANVIVDNPLDDSDMNGINASVWQDLPLEMDDKNPIVLIAKPFTQLNVEAADRTSNGTGFFKNTSDVRMNQTEDFFASVSATATPFAASNQLRGVSGGTFTNESNESSQLESGSFGNYNFANFRKKFFSRIVPL